MHYRVFVQPHPKRSDYGREGDRLPGQLQVPRDPPGRGTGGSVPARPERRMPDRSGGGPCRE